MTADMTDEEYDALDEEMTKADLHLTSVVGPVTRQKMPSRVIGERVREKIALRG